MDFCKTRNAYLQDKIRASGWVSPYAVQKVCYFFLKSESMRSQLTIYFHKHTGYLAGGAFLEVSQEQQEKPTQD